jgi:hypothetical protein
MEKFFSLAYIYLGYQDDNVEKALITSLAVTVLAG